MRTTRSVSSVFAGIILVFANISGHLADAYDAKNLSDHFAYVNGARKAADHLNESLRKSWNYLIQTKYQTNTLYVTSVKINIDVFIKYINSFEITLDPDDLKYATFKRNDAYLKYIKLLRVVSRLPVQDRKKILGDTRASFHALDVAVHGGNGIYPLPDPEIDN